jgi:hypothetical protein
MALTDGLTKKAQPKVSRFLIWVLHPFSGIPHDEKNHYGRIRFNEEGRENKGKRRFFYYVIYLSVEPRHSSS